MTTLVSGVHMREVQLKDVKASFSAVVEQAAQGEPTVVTRHGKPVAVVFGFNEWQALQGGRPAFADLLLSFPDVGELHRDPAPPRNLEL